MLRLAAAPAIKLSAIGNIRSATLREGARNKGHVNGDQTAKLTATKPLPSFDPKLFLARVGDGRSIGKYRKGQVVFAQGDPAMRCSTFRKARSSSPSFPSRARKPSSRFSDRTIFSARAVLPGSPAHRDGHGHDGLRHRAAGKVGHRPGASTRNRRSPKNSSPIFSAAAFASKRIWSINCSIRAKNGWPACSCCWRISARKERRSR